jgi:hypothetical protein
MNNPKSLMIDNVNYIRADAGVDAPYQIAVLDRGFVYIGRVAWNDNVLTITDAKCIRRWGTTKGLGELVNGPTPETILDTVGTVHVPEHSLIHLIDVVESAWKNI